MGTGKECISIKRRTMRKYVIIGVIVLCAIIAVQHTTIKRVKNERNLYRVNTHVLLSENELYRTKDSLNVVSIGQLQLTLKEYKKYRANDAVLIGTLKADNRRLKNITTAQTQTIYHLQGIVKDSIVYVDRHIIDTLQCVEISNMWFSLDGCMNRQKKFVGQFVSRDSLLYVEHIRPKRFLFFKWGIKERKQEIVSRNPHTIIMNAEFITIRD